MNLTASDALLWVERIISGAAIFQSLEFLSLRKVLGQNGVWTWTAIKKDFEIFPNLVQHFLNFLLSDDHFIYLLNLRFFCAILILMIPHSPLILVLFFSTVLISLRWRGSFNGGSDFMTLIVLSALSVASIFPHSPKVSLGCLWYISIQACTSYFVGGVIKLQRQTWRGGQALAGFFRMTIYPPQAFLERVSNSSLLSRFASWIILIFECSFPLALLNSQFASGFIGFAFLFHLVNFYIFGLNRFLFAWTATYPALYYCSRLS